LIYFLSILDSEFIKIGFTSQDIERRKSALQTGNSYEIHILHTTDGSMQEEKEIHRCLKEVFERLQVFNNPINEWYPGNNPIIKTFIGNVKNHGIAYSLENLNSIVRWDLRIKEDQIFTVRHLERCLRRNGLSRGEAKTLISKSKVELNDLFVLNTGRQSGTDDKPQNIGRTVILRKAQNA